ncbi:MAG: dephospho-CoA kinase [Ginsengibacter sp.]
MDKLLFLRITSHMLKIGLTGGIGSGKSVIAQMFTVLGIPVYYADEASKRLMVENEELKSAIKSHFGESAYVEGILNRKFLADIVFNDANKLTTLNSLVHPATLADATAWMQKQQAPYIIKEAALIFESGSNKSLDFVMGVEAPEEVRIKRVMCRDNVSAAQVKERIDKQMDEQEKLRLCDYVIVNNEHQMIIPQVLALHEKFLEIEKKINV